MARKLDAEVKEVNEALRRGQPLALQSIHRDENTVVAVFADGRKPVQASFHTMTKERNMDANASLSHYRETDMVAMFGCHCPYLRSLMLANVSESCRQPGLCPVQSCDDFRQESNKCRYKNKA